MSTASKIAFSQVERLTPAHRLNGFECPQHRVNHWLKKYALKNQQKVNSPITYVVHINQRVVGYYALVYGEVALELVTSRVKEEMPSVFPVPVMKLVWLGVDKSVAGRGLGTALLKDAFRRTLQAAEIAGMRAILVDAIDDEAVKFYTERGFEPSPIGPRQLFIRLDDIRAAITEEQEP